MNTIDEPWKLSWSRPRFLGFFQGMAILFLLLLLVGFAPTFFLRPWFYDSPLPVRFHIHGFFTACWILAFLVQALLVASGNIALHRLTGIVAASVAGGVLISGLAILYFLASGYPDNGRELGEVSSVVWGNIAGLATFSIFVGTGIALRSRPQTHKRMMLFATLSIMGPPLARIGHFDVFRLSDSLIVNDAAYGLGGLLALNLLVVIHDMRVLGRPHTTVLWAVPLQFISVIIAGLMIAGTDFGRSLILLVS